VNSKLTTDDETFEKYYKNYLSFEEHYTKITRKLLTCYSSTVSAYDYFDCIGDLKYDIFGLEFYDYIITELLNNLQGQWWVDDALQDY